VFCKQTNGLSDRSVANEAADIDHESDQVPKGHSVDALALRGDEGRGTLR
jgi:hypothetical protein